MSLEKRIEKLEQQSRSKDNSFLFIRGGDMTDEEIEEIISRYPEDTNVIISSISRPKDWGPAVVYHSGSGK